MQSIDLDGLNRAMERWDALIQTMPKRKQAALERLGQMLKTVVDSAIAGKYENGAVLKAWQKYYVGSGFGYVAVRAIGVKDGGATGPNGPAAITNYNENGHRIRRPSGIKREGYHYRSRIKTARVDGRYFYYQSADDAEREGTSMLAEIVQDLTRALEGAA